MALPQIWVHYLNILVFFTEKGLLELYLGSYIWVEPWFWFELSYPFFSSGKKIAQHPLHLSTLSQIEVCIFYTLIVFWKLVCLNYIIPFSVNKWTKVDVRGNTVLLMDLARQQGLLDAQMIGDSDRFLLRLMMPVAKMFCGKKVVANASECIECFGGQVGKLFKTKKVSFLLSTSFCHFRGTSKILEFLDFWEMLKSCLYGKVINK